ncbi:MAG TPA: NAD(P)-dependent oxidoreductase [Pirellulaceae bacterium]|nr:NAD(P)-dependent oxidoreductase [Pirellulaceae bacterium]
MANSPIGLIGCGLLGSALAERMMAGGLPLVGFDRDLAASDRLRQLGAEPVASAVEVARTAAAIVLCLPDSHVVVAVVDQLAAALKPGALLIDATTGDPDRTAALADRLSASGIGYIDATIAGSSDQARRGEAVVIVGGRPADVERAQPVLRTWSDRQFHVGPPGSGARMKLVVNLVLGLNRAVLAEGLSLAEASGIELARALEVLHATPAYSAAMDTKGPKMVSGDFSPVARLAQHLKDVRLILALAERHAAHTPLSNVHEELLKRAVELGLGEADNSAIIRAFRPARQQHGEA